MGDTGERFTKEELDQLYPDGVPILLMKLLFPSKSDDLTVGELRQIARALANHAPMRNFAITESMVNAADSVLSRVRPGIPDEAIRHAIAAALASHTSALAERDARIAELEAALDGIRVYGSDTLSGRVDGPADKDWYRDGVREMRNRARAALAKEQADA